MTKNSASRKYGSAVLLCKICLKDYIKQGIIDRLKEAAMKEQKTNVVRLLEKAKTSFSAHEYPHGDEAVDGLTVANICGFDSDQVFKTLVARGASKTIYVFVIPVSCELDLKKAAKAAGEKSVAMIHVSEINPLTGYVRGGCSPIGMKKQYKTFFNESALQMKTIMVSAGKIGLQVELAPSDLLSLTRGNTADLVAAK